GQTFAERAEASHPLARRPRQCLDRRRQLVSAALGALEQISLPPGRSAGAELALPAHDGGNAAPDSSLPPVPPLFVERRPRLCQRHQLEDVRPATIEALVEVALPGRSAASHCLAPRIGTTFAGSPDTMPATWAAHRSSASFFSGPYWNRL